MSGTEGDPLRRCRSRARLLERNAFYAYATNRDGLHARCKECVRTYYRERYRAKRDAAAVSAEEGMNPSRRCAVANVEMTVGPWQVRCGPLSRQEDPDWWLELRYAGSDGAIDFCATLGPHEALAIGTALVEMARTAQGTSEESCTPP